MNEALYDTDAIDILRGIEIVEISISTVFINKCHLISLLKKLVNSSIGYEPSSYDLLYPYMATYSLEIFSLRISVTNPIGLDLNNF